ncbi:NAD(P)/FAD-dependent oxidoreductase [Streptomyces sp. NPDC053079]|uniref:NAD(P)/FAD-dependent oxidoreductase n=1 Tax=Streptomyces sp. NPDC053079 TaxID=3365697 RepID=UPI0037D3B6D3
MTPRPAPLRVAVAGAGMAAARFAHQALSLAPPGTLEVTLYGREHHAPYNRTLLTGVLAGQGDPTALTLPTGGALVRTGVDVVSFDPASRTLRTATGETVRYDALVLATGARPELPDIRNLHAGPRPPARTAATGPDPAPRGALGTRTRPATRPAAGRPLKDGVHALRTLADGARLAGDLPRARRAVVVGGGVLGVGAAQALAARGLPVHLVHRAPHLMERHLDAGAAAAVRRSLEALGVRVHTGRGVRALLGGDRVTGLEIADGPLLETELAVLACGTRPRTRLARAAGLTVRTGVVVDDNLATSAPGVHAIGDCAEHRGTVHGRAEAAFDQADVLAAHLSGARPGARYTGSPALLRLSAGPLRALALGDGTGPSGPDTDTVRLTDATRGTYKKLVLRGDALLGALLVGDLATAPDLVHAFERGEPVPPDPLHLLTTEGAAP